MVVHSMQAVCMGFRWSVPPQELVSPELRTLCCCGIGLISGSGATLSFSFIKGGGCGASWNGWK